MNLAKLRNYLEELSKDTFYGDLDRAEVVRSVIELNSSTSYIPSEVNNDVVLSGTNAATTSTYLSYGVNNVTTASATAYAVRLPYPPQKGKQVIVVNTSAMPIAVYPSINGGSINNLYSGASMVPNDGNSYTFYCYENPLPGGWTWTPPATNQYDSGEIIMTQATTAGFLSAYNNATINYNSTTSVSTSTANDGVNKAPILSVASDGIYFKPATPWNSITKIKVYTNNKDNASSVSVKLSSQISYYNTSTGVVTGYGTGLATDILSTSSINSVVPGTFVPVTTDRSAFAGSDGSLYKEFTVSPIPGVAGILGDKYLGQVISSGVLRNAWQTGYIKFVFNPNAIIDGAGTRFRFFIEYN